MLYRELLRLLPKCGGRECVAQASTTLTSAGLVAEAETRSRQLRDLAGAKVAVYVADGPPLVALLCALDHLGAQAYLISGETTVDEARALLQTHPVAVCLTDRVIDDAPFRNLGGLADSPLSLPPEPPATDRSARVILFTSGTSGKPKGALHTWDSLAAGIKRNPHHDGAHWLLTYGLTRLPGLQVFLQAVLNGGRLAIPAQQGMPHITELLATDRIENVSGTPTFWRKLLTGARLEQLQRCPLKQITLGGEIVGQTILNGLQRAFPAAQITHIYASTEMGVCFSVKDGKEGFPAALLNVETGGITLRVQDGELLIRSTRAMTNYLGQPAIRGEWFSTGDLVEVRGARVYFLGRNSEIINVGGSKVFPAEVEEELHKVSGVVEVRVYGERSSFVGQLVAAEIVAGPTVAVAGLRERINHHCAQSLPSYKRPRLLRFVPAIAETDSRKVMRQLKGP